MLLRHVTQINQDVRDPDARVLDAVIIRSFPHRVGQVREPREELILFWEPLLQVVRAEPQLPETELDLGPRELSRHLKLLVSGASGACGDVWFGCPYRERS